MPATKVQIIGGAFQDFEGNALANGFLLFELNQDEQIPSVGELCAGLIIRVGLDKVGDVYGTNTFAISTVQVISNVLNIVSSATLTSVLSVGDVVVFPAGMAASFLSSQSVTVLTVSTNSFTAAFTHANYGPTAETAKSGTIGAAVRVWPNSVMSPINSFYTVRGYSAAGQLAWGPNAQQVANTDPFNLNTWVPNRLITWNPALQTPTLQTNEVNNGSQSLLDLKAGTGITLADNGLGRVTITSQALPLALKVNGTPNASQTILNLKSGSNITVSDAGAGDVTIAATIPAVVATGPMAVINERFVGSALDWRDQTMAFKVKASTILTPGTKLKIIFMSNDANGVVGAAKIRRTLAGNTTYVDSTTITWGGSATPTFTGTPSSNISDEISITIDTLHDYYFLVYFTSGSSGSQKLPFWDNAIFTDFLGGFQSGNQTGVATFTGYGVTNNIYGWAYLQVTG